MIKHTVSKFTGLLQIVLFAVFIGAVFIVLTSRFSLFGMQSMVVLTGSMEPAIPAGSIVLVKKADGYAEGDILTFKNKAGVLVTHRLVERVSSAEGLRYRVKGDANDAPDADLVLPDDVVGAGIFHIPQVGKLSRFLKTPTGFIGLIIAPAVIFISYELWNMKREIVRETEKRLLIQMSNNHKSNSDTSS